MSKAEEIIQELLNKNLLEAKKIGDIDDVKNIINKHLQPEGGVIEGYVEPDYGIRKSIQFIVKDDNLAVSKDWVNVSLLLPPKEREINGLTSKKLDEAIIRTGASDRHGKYPFGELLWEELQELFSKDNTK